MSGPIFPFASTKTYGSNFVDLIENFLSLYPSLLSLSLSRPPPSIRLVLLTFYFFIYFFMCPSFIRVYFYPETIYLFSIQFILNELSSSHFLTSEIFVKISFLESLMTYHYEIRKKIPIVLEFDEIFLGHLIL